MTVEISSSFVETNQGKVNCVFMLKLKFELNQKQWSVLSKIYV